MENNINKVSTSTHIKNWFHYNGFLLIVALIIFAAVFFCIRYVFNYPEPKTDNKAIELCNMINTEVRFSKTLLENNQENNDLLQSKIETISLLSQKFNAFSNINLIFQAKELLSNCENAKKACELKPFKKEIVSRNLNNITEKTELITNESLFENKSSGLTVFEKMAIALIIIWLGILFAYFGWAVYFYNINLGYSNREWELMYERQLNARNKQQTLNEYIEADLQIPNENPYRDETFGLPNGTVRGSIAMTIIVGILALFILSFGFNGLKGSVSFIEANYNFFTTAFLMIIAFYFGNKSLDTLFSKKSSTSDSKDSGETGKTKSLTSDNQPETPIEEDKTKTTQKKSVAKEVTNSEKPVISPSIEHEALISRKLQEEDIDTVSKNFDIEKELINTVIQVESKNNGFLSDNRPVILFEGHVFWRELEKLKFNPEIFLQTDENKDILYKQWTTSFYKGGSKEYERLDKAIKINKKAALKSASWGLFQIMGFNHELAGFVSVEEFVDSMYKTEKEHLTAFCNFIEKTKIIDDLRSKKWTEFAKKYNGPGFALNQYDKKLEKAYLSFTSSNKNSKT